MQDVSGLNSRLIVLDGLDGAGTTTQARVLASRLARRGVPTHLTRQPSDGPAGRLLREFLAGGHALPDQRLDSATLALLFAADRVDHLQREVEPQLRDGRVVVSDRWYHSSLVYQGYALPGGEQERPLRSLLGAQLPRLARRTQVDRTAPQVDWTAQLNRYARRPDLTILLLVDPEVAARRRAEEGRAQELFDNLEVQRRVHDGYLQVAQLARSWHERVEVLDGEASIDDVGAQIARLVDDLLGSPDEAPGPVGEDALLRAIAAAPPRELPVHVVDQAGQPYGSSRSCCNMCGLMVHPGMQFVDSAAEWWDLAATARCTTGTGG